MYDCVDLLHFENQNINIWYDSYFEPSIYHGLSLKNRINQQNHI